MGEEEEQDLAKKMADLHLKMTASGLAAQLPNPPAITYAPNDAAVNAAVDEAREIREYEIDWVIETNAQNTEDKLILKDLVELQMLLDEMVGIHRRWSEQGPIGRVADHYQGLRNLATLIKRINNAMFDRQNANSNLAVEKKVVDKQTNVDQKPDKKPKPNTAVKQQTVEKSPEASGDSDSSASSDSPSTISLPSSSSEEEEDDLKEKEKEKRKKGKKKFVLISKEQRSKPPLFTGKVSEWKPFLDQFEFWLSDSGIKKQTLKLQGLQQAMPKNYAILISKIPLSETCYDQALLVLKNRFNSPKLAMAELARNLFELSEIKNQSDLLALKSFLDSLEANHTLCEVWKMENAYFLNNLLPIIYRKLPEELKRWIDNHDITSYKKLLKYLNRRYATLLATATDFSLIKRRDKSSTDKKVSQPQAAIASASASVSNDKKSKPKRSFSKPQKKANFACTFCDKEHESKACDKYKSAAEKRARLAFLQRCFSCLRRNHHPHPCPVSKPLVCTCCSQAHYSFMCDRAEQSSSTQNTASSAAIAAICNVSVFDEISLPLDRQRIMRAYVVGTKEAMPVRLFCDEGAMFNIATWRLVKALNLKPKRMKKLKYKGQGGAINIASHCVELSLTSLDGSHTYKVMCCIDDEIAASSCPVPDSYIRLAENQGIKFSDLEFGDKPNDPIDLLLANFDANNVSGEKVFLNDHLIAINSIFGWGLTGRDASIQLDNKPRNVSSCSILPEEDLFNLKRMWTMEGITDSNKIESDFRLSDYENLISFKNNRYHLRLLWAEDPKELKSNFSVAYNRVMLLKNSLTKKNQFEMYDKAITEYLQNENAEVSYSPANEGYYLPHHAVFRDDKSTTKVRVVLEGNSHSSGNKSLNDFLKKGADLLPKIFTLLIQFRLKPVAIIADFEKAFLQLRIDPEDRKYLKYVWFDAEGKLKHYQMTSVIFGANCSPFLLALVIQHHIEQNKAKCPLAYKSKSNFYVDDLVQAVDTPTAADQLQKELKNLFSLCSMNLRKWRSSDKQLDKKWSEDKQSEEANVLGLVWSVEKDQLSVKPAKIKEILTKRNLLSIIASIFDPIGLLCPILIHCKCCLQNLFRLKVNWDKELTGELLEDAETALKDLVDLSKICVPRYVGASDELTAYAVFCDASMTAYGVTVYAVDRGTGKARLLTAKSRVTPLKPLTIPQLELVAAAFACELWRKLDLPAAEVRFYSDSEITLGRLRTTKEEKKSIFVRRRVEKILQISSAHQWYHVPTKDNPADLASRGCSAIELADNQLWWQGPPWLGSHFKNHAAIASVSLATQFFGQLSTYMQTPAVNAISATCCNDFDTLNKWSTFDSLINFRIRTMKNIQPNLTNEKVYNLISIKWQQAIAFPKLLQDLQQTKFIQVKQHTVYLETDGLIRVKTRFQTGNPDIDSPALLDGNCKMTILWIKRIHRLNAHSGLAVLKTNIRSTYEVLSLNQACRKAIQLCLLCRHATAKPFQHADGMLPAFRTAEFAFFQHIGIDHFGPFQIKERGRRNASFPIYVLIMTCASTRFVHLEPVDSLSAADTLGALCRAFSRRGVPKSIHSDNGTGFVSLASEFKRMQETASPESSFLFPYPMPDWLFSSPYAPWQGGFWERLVGCVKKPLTIILQSRTTSRTQFLTLLAQSEAIVNSRPLVETDGEILTPAHFAGSSNLLSIPSPSKHTIGRKSIVTHYTEYQQTMHEVWRKWKQSYLPALRNRWWKQSSVDIAVNDLVLVSDKNAPRGRWPIARVLAVYTARDGVTRKADVEFNGRTYTNRATRTLIPFEASRQNEN